MQLVELYNLAKFHKENHKSCGGEPYKSFLKLENLVKVYQRSALSLKILEIGTAVGFTTYILHNYKNMVDTIEFHQEHTDEAKKNIATWGGDFSKIEYYVGDAKDILHDLSQTNSNVYDIIFFDGYGAKHHFYSHFESLLKKDGLLITANKFLKSTEKKFFTELEDINKWEFIEDFEDTVVHKKICN